MNAISKRSSHKFFPKNPQKYVGNPQNIVCRSSWEHTFMQYCDHNPNIVRWASEELAIPYYFTGDQKWHKYYPDFIVHVKTTLNEMQVWMVEIKPYQQTLHPQTKSYRTQRQQLREVFEYAKNQSKWEAAKQFCVSKGWIFKVITEKELYPKQSS